MVNRKNANNVLLKTAQYAQEKLLKLTGNLNNNNANASSPSTLPPSNQPSNVVPVDYLLANPSLLQLSPNNIKILEWVIEQAKLLKPQSIRVVNGSEEENKELIELLLAQGSLLKLNDQFPNSYAAFSDHSDVARVEKQTFICSDKEEDAGPTNNWKNPLEMMAILNELFDGSMRGRTMYVIPYSMGPIGSPFSRYGVEITDSPYVVLNMRIMTRIGKPVLEQLKDENNIEYIPCVHSVGAPLKEGEKDVPWPSNPTKYIVHFPQSNRIYSFGSGYGGNALLGKKCFALRIASVLGKREGWLAEHMLILSVTNPLGEKKYFAAAFPSACGKTNLAMLNPTLPGWKIETLGDDIAWIRPGKDGRLYACNPENGFFGVAPGTSPSNNPNALKTLQSNSLFTNVAITDDGGVWWEGLTDSPPPNLTSWTGKKHLSPSDGPYAHPNSRFTAPIAQCPTIDKDWNSPEGVPLSGILFGGRRKTTIPLVREAADWENGVFFGASISSEQTAAAEGTVGALRHDPFAMLPFCGYNMADYFQHWFDIQSRSASLSSSSSSLLPKVFYVNWFRCGADGKFLWPGFGENCRVLKWIFQRCSGECAAIDTPIGLLPKPGDLDLPLSVSDQSFDDLFKINIDDWKNEVASITQFLSQFGDKLPLPMLRQLQLLKERLAL